MFYEELNSILPYAKPEELEYLRKEAFKLKSEQEIVIIGGGPCIMGIAMLEQHPNSPQCSVIDINSLEYSKAHFQAAGIWRIPNTNIQLVQGDSSHVGFEWTKKIDLLIVDGDHSYSGVSKDIRAWWPHVVIGGLVFFHDYLQREDGFNGTGEWEKSDVATAIEDCRDSSWVLVKQVGISVIYMRV